MLRYRKTPRGCVRQKWRKSRCSGTKANLGSVKMAKHRGGRGEARYGYAPGRFPAVFLFGRMGLWNGDRDCEPAQLIAAARMGELGREAPPRTERRNPAPVAPRRGFATKQNPTRRGTKSGLRLQRRDLIKPRSLGRSARVVRFRSRRAIRTFASYPGVASLSS